MDKRKILVTGFTPFLTNKVNPSELLSQSLSQSGFSAEVLDVSYEDAKKRLNEEFLSAYDFVLSFGLASSRKSISLERCAYNQVSQKVKDNKNEIFHSCQVIEKGNDVLFTNLELEKIKENLDKAGINSSLSTDPGRYLCNFVYYTSLFRKRGNALFVHLPNISSDFPFLKMEEAGRLILDYIIKNR
jgi:pyroglutamyl-peptidase